WSRRNGGTAAGLLSLNPHPSESGSPMKMQWVLVCVVLAAIVFVFTYLKLNSGLSSEPPPPQPSPVGKLLYFPRTESRDKEQGPVGAEWEYRVPGHHDFWFENTYDEP